MKLRLPWKEYPDPTPVAIPTGYHKPEPLHMTIQRLVKNELSQAANDKGGETFEEANDFDLDDDDFPQSPYELTPMQEEAFYEPRTTAGNRATDGARHTRPDEPARGAGSTTGERMAPGNPGVDSNEAKNELREHQGRPGNSGGTHPEGD